jgi:hypothetical protein
MRNIPIDTTRIALAFIDCAAVDAYDRTTGEVMRGTQRRSDEGMPLWNVNALAIVEGVDGGETVRVRVPAETAPVFDPLARIEFDELNARPWEQNGRSGVSLSATAVRVAGSSNGRASRSAVTAATGEGS